MESLDEILRKALRTNSFANTLKDSVPAGSQGQGTEAGFEGHCDVCDDARWLSLRAPVGSPDFGKLVPCQCLLRAHAIRRVERLQDYSELGALARQTFENMDSQGREPFADPLTFRKANETAKVYAADPAGWLVIYGPSGVGKTHLGAAIANHAMRLGKPAKFVFVPEFLDRLRASFGEGGAPPKLSEAEHGPFHTKLDSVRAETDKSPSSFEDLLTLAAAAPLLVLDDLGAQTATPWADEKLRQIIAYRYDNRLPTVVTTRTAPEAMDEWLKSRLMDPSFVRLVQVKAGAMNADLTDIGVEPRLRQVMTFERFEPRGGAGATADQREQLHEALKLAQAFSSDPHGWLYLSGPTGTGKTHLAVAIAVARMSQKRPVLFRFVPDLLDHMRRTFSPDSATSYDRLFERTKNSELLILDDFGAQAWTQWAEEKMYQLVVHRHNAALPTVITSRVLLDDVDDANSQGDMRFGRRYSDAIASRLRDSSVVTEVLLPGPDYRYRGSEQSARERQSRPARPPSRVRQG